MGWSGEVRTAILRAMKIVRLPLLAGLALAVLLPFAIVPAPAQASAAKAATRPFGRSPSKQVAHRLSGEVYGFLPYWLETPETAAGAAVPTC